ncbi:type II toxin-antitoxin system VapC family toxin [Parapedobacter tibetensis]|uniref:type II toxin-antitoxin system VapC family toxin n=1 Tax=Parapedobacter tibetensis TaxID=2972951 RepID=UPI00214D27AD|nr:type II toxin-antitoxin system VapC family toxin [Parapedobacter tibetensis]
MGKGYLMDTNAVIDYLGDKLPPKGSSLMDKLPITISVVTRIEVLGWYGINEDQLKRLTSFMNDAIIYPLEETYVERTILLRQRNKIKLPDAAIAATALVEGLTLITRNMGDFSNISGLEIINPHDL